MLSYLEEKNELINQQIEEFLPKTINEDWIKQYIGKTKLDPEMCTELVAPIWNLLERGGKRWRPVLMLLCCDAVDGGSKILDFIPLVELLHNGTLIIDDIEDDSDTRRNQPSIHKMYGVDVAVNTGNMLYFLPHLIIKHTDIDNKLRLNIHELVAEEMFKLHIGQGMDIHWHNNGTGINEDAYLQMCAFKTGVLARLSAKLGALFGDTTNGQINAIGRFAEAIGVAFQIQDDILNISGTGLGKDFADDVTEGKRSLMVIHVLENGNKKDKAELVRILNLGTTDIKQKYKVIEILNKYNAIDYSRKLARDLVMEAWNNLNPVLKDSESKQLLKKFAYFLIEREL